MIDQFSRNIFRGKPAAFEHDEKALGYSQSAVEHEYDSALSVPENIFLYMPMMHSEQLVDRAEGPYREMAEGLLDYAIEHRGIIEQFGRFPHRNDILDRSSTASEKQFLASGASSYGQE